MIACSTNTTDMLNQTGFLKGYYLKDYCIFYSSCKSSNSPYSVQMRENADQNNSEYGHFSRTVILKRNIFKLLTLKVLSCKLFNNKYMTASTQITNSEIFAFSCSSS